MKTKTIKGPIHIEGRRWFQKSFGNTYHSVRIFQGGEQIACIGETYGYDYHFLQTAGKWLSENGYPELKTQSLGTLYLRETLGGSYSVIDVEREKDL